MENCKFNLVIKPADIYNCISLENRSKFKVIKIINANVLDSGEVELVCLALENEVIEYPYRLLFDQHINLKEF